MSLENEFMMFTSTSFFAIVLCWWGWASYSAPVIYKNQLESIFTNTSIFDISDGSMDRMVQWLNMHPVTLVVFYASWSGQCMKIVPEVLSVKSMLDDSVVSVIGMNCWIGQCRQNFHSYYFPRLFLYHTTHAPIEYLDEIKAHKIVDFVQFAVRPFVYIGTAERLVRFRRKYDSSVIAYMDHSKLVRSKEFDVFIATSVHLVNRVNAPKVGLVIQENLANSLGLYVHGNLSLNSFFFSTKYYSKLANYTKDDIVRWIVSNSRQLVNRLTPNASDSLIYVNQLRHASLILAHPSVGIDFNLIEKFHSVAMDYYNCRCLKRNIHHYGFPLHTHNTLRIHPIAATFDQEKECSSCIRYKGFSYTISNGCIRKPPIEPSHLPCSLDVKTLYMLNNHNNKQCVLYEEQSNHTTECSTLRARRTLDYGYEHSACCYIQSCYITVCDHMKEMDKNGKSQRDEVLADKDKNKKLSNYERNAGDLPEVNIQKDKLLNIKHSYATVIENLQKSLENVMGKLDEDMHNTLKNKLKANINAEEVEKMVKFLDVPNPDTFLSKIDTENEKGMSAREARKTVEEIMKDAVLKDFEKGENAVKDPKEDLMKQLLSMDIDSIDPFDEPELNLDDYIQSVLHNTDNLKFKSSESTLKESLVNTLEKGSESIHFREEAFDILNSMNNKDSNSRAESTKDSVKNTVDSSNDLKSQITCGNNAPCCVNDLVSTTNISELHLQGLACETNRTLNFYLLDNLQYKYLLENAGLTTTQPLLFLVDMETKSHFTLNGDLDYSSIVNFIFKFTAGQLVREYVSLHPSSHNPLHEGVVELTTETFQEKVIDIKKHVFVMFYSSWCGMCKPSYRVFLQLMKSFKTDPTIRFARIDGDRNPLPWQYSASVYPSFVLFPLNRKGYSFPYPDDLEITVENFAHFLGSNV